MEFKRKPFIYFSQPYSHTDSSVVLERVLGMQEIIVEVMKDNRIIPYSPILYTHPLSHELDPDFDWYEWDKQALDRCDGMVVVQFRGWSVSKGVQIEMAHCREHDIPFVCANPDMGSVWTAVDTLIDIFEKVA